MTGFDKGADVAQPEAVLIKVSSNRQVCFMSSTKEEWGTCFIFRLEMVLLLFEYVRVVSFAYAFVCIKRFWIFFLIDANIVVWTRTAQILLAFFILYSCLAGFFALLIWLRFNYEDTMSAIFAVLFVALVIGIGVVIAVGRQERKLARKFDNRLDLDDD
jgi:hypothetical protein